MSPAKSPPRLPSFLLITIGQSAWLSVRKYSTWKQSALIRL